VVSFSHASPQQPCMHLFSPHTCYMPCPSQSCLFDHPNVIGWGVQRIKFFLYNLLHSRVTSSLSGPNTLLSTQFSKTLSIHSSLNVSDQVLQPYVTLTVTNSLQSMKGCRV
jgi:hypothetical protein